MSRRAPSVPRFARRSLARPFAAFTVLFLAFAGFVPAQQNEHAVRAAFVFNLTKYVTWPGPRDRLVIGVIGPGNFGPALKEVLDGKLSDGRPINVMVHSLDAELGECDVLYITAASPAEVKSILNRVGGRAVLTVGDSDQFVRAGGMVGLVRSGDQIEIKVNLPALRSRQLNMSSRLLKLAVLVPTGGDSR